jgi:hypothetical protein
MADDAYSHYGYSGAMQLVIAASHCESGYMNALIGFPPVDIELSASNVACRDALEKIPTPGAGTTDSMLNVNLASCPHAVGSHKSTVWGRAVRYHFPVPSQAKNGSHDPAFGLFNMSILPPELASYVEKRIHE